MLKIWNNANPKINIHLFLLYTYSYNRSYVHVVAFLLEDYATCRNVVGLFPCVAIWFFFDRPNPSGLIMVLGSTQFLTEMSATKLPKDKGRTTDNLTAICERSV
jgi:hypothetical protein